MVFSNEATMEESDSQGQRGEGLLHRNEAISIMSRRAALTYMEGAILLYLLYMVVY